MRVIFDTNVLIDGFTDDHNSPAKLLTAAERGEIEMLITPAINREYAKLLQHTIADSAYLSFVNQLIDKATLCSPRPADPDLIIDDHDDVKFIEAALGGQAQLLITRDRHLLDIGEIGPLGIVTPDEAWHRFQASGSSASEWDYWKQGLGI